LPLKPATIAKCSAIGRIAALACLTVPIGAFADADLPTGPRYASAIERPVDEPGARPACSVRYPVCVHASRKVPSSSVLGTLADLEHAAALLTGGMGLPMPLDDGKLGGSPAFDLYLLPARTI